MNEMNKQALLLLTTFLTGCSILGGGELPPLYTLKSEYIEPSAQAVPVIAIETPLAEASLNTERISVKPSPYQRDYIADGQWPDRLPKVVQEVFVDSFSQRWGGAHVTRSGSGLQTQYILQSEIQEFSVSNLETETPEIHLKIMLKIADLKERTVIASQTFEEKLCIPDHNLREIVAGFNHSLHHLIETAIPWMEAFLKRTRS